MLERISAAAIEWNIVRLESKKGGNFVRHRVARRAHDEFVNGVRHRQKMIVKQLGLTVVQKHLRWRDQITHVGCAKPRGNQFRCDDHRRTVRGRA